MNRRLPAMAASAPLASRTADHHDCHALPRLASTPSGPHPPSHRQHTTLSNASGTHGTTQPTTRLHLTTASHTLRPLESLPHSCTKLPATLKLVTPEPQLHCTDTCRAQISSLTKTSPPAQHDPLRDHRLQFTLLLFSRPPLKHLLSLSSLTASRVRREEIPIILC